MPSETPAITPTLVTTARGDWRGIRLKFAVKVPAAVLFSRHARYARELSTRPQDFEDAIGDGMLELCRMDAETDPGVTPPEFLGLAHARLTVYYRQHYRRAKGLYRDPTTGERRKKLELRRVEADLGLVPDVRPARDNIVGRVDELLGVLTKGERAVVSRAYLDGKGLRGAAELLGINPRTAKKFLKSYLAKMRAYHDAAYSGRPVPTPV